MKKTLCSIATGFALMASVSAQPVQHFAVAANPEEAGMSSERLKRIDKMINEHINNQWIPGAVVLIARNCKIIYNKAYGYSDIENKTPLKKDDIFRIASMTKAITSTAVMMLWEEGKFLLDDPVSSYIPEFKKAGILKTFNPADSSYTAVPLKNEVTIRQLLTHTWGNDYANSEELTAIYAKAGVPRRLGNSQMLLADKMKILASLPLRYQPGEQWAYSSGTDMLGYLVEVLSGMPLDEFFRKKIFGPLGMKDTYFYLPPEKQHRLVPVYVEKNGKSDHKADSVFDEIGADYPKTTGKFFSGGGGLSSTTEDYAKILQMFLNKGQYNGNRLLGPKTIELILTNQIHIPGEERQIGLGFRLETPASDYQSPVSIGSFWWSGAFNTHYWADPKEGIIGILFTSVDNTSYWNIGEKFRSLTYQAILK